MHKVRASSPRDMKRSYPKANMMLMMVLTGTTRRAESHDDEHTNYQ